MLMTPAWSGAALGKGGRWAEELGPRCWGLGVGGAGEACCRIIPNDSKARATSGTEQHMPERSWASGGVS